MTSVPTDSLTALIERARSAMAGNIQPDAEPVTGEAADGLVRATIGTDGRLQELTVDPKLLRRPLEEMCAEIVLAVNTAIDARPDRIDTAPLLNELRSVQEQSVVEMNKISTAFSEALNRALQR